MQVFDIRMLTPEQTVRLNEIADLKRKEYYIFIDKMSSEIGNCFEWWVSEFSTRNSDYAFFQVCRLLLVEELVQKESDISEIIVDDRGLFNDLRKIQSIINKGITIKYAGNNKKNLLVYRLAAFVFIWMKKVREFWIIKRKKFQMPQNGESIDLLIDTYVLDSCFDKLCNYDDRYYSGIMKYVDSNTRFSTIFVPNVDESFSLFMDKVKGEKKYTFIVKENFLTFLDYLRMWRYPFYCMRFMKRKYYIKDYDISSIVRQDIVHGIPSYNTMDGYISYSFVKRLKKQGIKLKTVVLWYEGQPCTVGYSIGVNKFYPNVNLKGFFELSPMKNMLGFFPSSGQVIHKVVPSVIGVMSSMFKESLKMYAIGLTVPCFPAFRYYGNRKLCKNELCNGDKKCVFVILPYDVDVSSTLLKDVAKALKSMNSMVKIYIKNHPNNSDYTLTDYGISESDIYLFTDAAVIDMASQVDVAINAMSSSGMEIIAEGTFLITYIPCGKLNNCGIPPSISSDLYYIAYNSDDIYSGLKFGFSHKKLEREKLQQVFEPIDEVNIKKMIE